jgi:hypothetical protein
VRQDPLQGRGQEDITLALAWVLATAPDEQLRDGGGGSRGGGIALRADGTVCGDSGGGAVALGNRVSAIWSLSRRKRNSSFLSRTGEAVSDRGMPASVPPGMETSAPRMPSNCPNAGSLSALFSYLTEYLFSEIANMQLVFPKRILNGWF